MDLNEVRKKLEKEGNSENVSIVDSMRTKFFQPFLVQGIKVDLVQPGRIVCTMIIPSRLLNTANTLHGGAMAALVDLMGSAAILTTQVGDPSAGVSVEISVSFVDAVYTGGEMERDSKVLCIGKAIAVVIVELRKKKMGKVVAQGCHTKYLTVSSKM